MDNFKIEAMDTAAAEDVRYNVFGVSRTHKGRLAMRGTSEAKYAARMQVFKRDGDTGVVMVKIGFMHKSKAARILSDNAEFAQMCVDKGHDWSEVREFLLKQAGVAAAVAVLPSIAAAPQTDAVQEEAAQEEQQAAADAEVAELLDEQQDTAQLLEQQEAADAGDEPEESVEQSRKQRRRR